MNERTFGCSSFAGDGISPGDQGNGSANAGTVVAVRGSVIDAHFPNRLPQINTLLQAGKSRSIAIEVLSQLDEQHIRGIALTGTQGLCRGMPVIATDGPIRAPVGPNILSLLPG